MNSRVLRRLVSVTLTLCLIIGSVGMAFASTNNTTNMSDIPNILAQEMNNRETTIVINYSGSETTQIANYPLSSLLAKAYRTTADDYLKWNWTKFSFTATSSATNKLQISVTAAYYTTKAQEDQISAKVDEVLSQIIKSGMTDFDKVNAVNQWVVDNVSYDSTMTKRSAYNALFDHKAVCQGYALVIDRFLKKLGIPARIESGTLNGLTHGWNIVNLGGTWYQLDTTNNDSCQNMFFLVSDNFLKEHGYSWTCSDYPSCDSNYDNQKVAIEEASAAVSKAEQSWTKSDYDIALSLVNILPASTVKETLQFRLSNVLEQVNLKKTPTVTETTTNSATSPKGGTPSTPPTTNTPLNSQSSLVTAENYVKTAEAKPTQSTLDAAEKRVAVLKDSEEKTAFEKRLAVVADSIEALLLSKATTLVVKAESSITSSNISAAEKALVK